jgi:imidazole glycerol-phosphate synthase subunit HisF
VLTTRVIPCLLLKGSGLVKTVRFDKPRYVGDILNAVRIFNDKEVDEIIILDIEAHERPGRIKWELVRDLASECFMPMCYGGGVTRVDDFKRLSRSGAEKVAVNTAAAESPKLIEAAAREFGSQSVVVGIDVRKTLFGKYAVVTHGGAKKQRTDVVAYARDAEAAGAGELLLTSVDRDGTGTGYDLELLKMVTAAVRIPVIACGGAGRLSDFKAAVDGGASAVAAGSMFVFHGPHRAVLITYPERHELESCLRK